MSQKTAITALACAPGTVPGGPLRTRFFDGMFLTQADLENEQRYWRLKRRLTNRALGEGVVWGLRLAWSQQQRRFALTPGYAIDCCGNDLLVECPLELTEAELWSRADPSLKTPKRSLPPPPPPPPTTPPENGPDVIARALVAGPDELEACVVLQYTECPEESRPVHRDACAGPTGYCEPSRVRESARLVLMPPPAPRPPLPPQQFLDALEKFRDGLPAAIREQLFPTQGSPPTTTSTGQAPVSLRTTIPGSPSATVTLQIPASGSINHPTALSAAQVPAVGRRTGVVTFELLPSSGWSFTAGRVQDGTRTVETVTPPAAPSMYWTLDIALPDGVETAAVDFEFLVDDVEVAQTFGGTSRGRVRARVTGRARVTNNPSAGNLLVEIPPTDTSGVGGLQITTELSEVTEAEGQGCLGELIPWGWAANLDNAHRVGGVIILSGLYAFLSETVARGASQGTQNAARALYAAAWYALFGANAMSAAPEQYRRQLAELILAHYQRWCEGFAYPGPRCHDEHQGVYLGCVTLTRSGAITGFDMWAHRRYVLTGPLLNHWAGQLGVAPLDVIVGRFASAFCCLAGQPAIALPTMIGQFPPGLGGDNLERFHVGTVASVEAFAASHNATVRWTQPFDLIGKAIEVFTSGGGGPYDVYAAQIPDGGTVALAVREQSNQPNARVAYPRLRADVLTLLRRGPNHTRERGRDAVADFAIAVMRAAPANAIVAPDTSEPARRMADAVTARGGTLADVFERGTDATVARARLGTSAAEHEAAAELVELAEEAVDDIASVTVELFGPNLDRAAFASPEGQKKLAAVVAGKVIPKLAPEAVVGAARRVSATAPR